MINYVRIEKVGSANNGKVLEAVRSTKAGGVVVTTPAGFRTYQAGEFVKAFV
jgi:hypothetical protein